MEELGRGFYWQELPVGRTFKTIGRSIFEADMIGFVGVTGMSEVLFTNLEYIEHESPTRKRIVPGALVFALAEGLVMQATLQKVGMAFLNMSFDIKGPVVIGDTIHVELEVIEARPTSKGGNGLVRTRNRVINQRGECAIEYTPLRLIKGKPAA